MSAERGPGPFSAFLPLCLVSLSVAIFLGWQTSLAVTQRQELISMAARQRVLAGQAAQTESQLQSLIMDLLRLAEKDEDAKAIVNKYNIRFNPSANAGPAGALGPGSAPDAAAGARPPAADGAAGAAESPDPGAVVRPAATPERAP